MTLLEDEVLCHELRLDWGASGGVDEEADRLETPQGEGPVDGGPGLLHVDVLALADGALDDEDRHLGLRLPEVKTVHHGEVFAVLSIPFSKCSICHIAGIVFVLNVKMIFDDSVFVSSSSAFS